MARKFFKTDPWPRGKKMTFGKHKGTPVCEVPADYLLWLYYTDWLEVTYPGLYEYIKRRFCTLLKAQREERLSHDRARARGRRGGRVASDYFGHEDFEMYDGLMPDYDWM